MTKKGYKQSIDADRLAVLAPEEQRAVMESWFRERYEAPDHRTPYDSEEGDYVWIWGGPYDAAEALRSEFEGVVPDNVIEELVDDLNDEASEWAPVPSDDDYDHTLLDVVSTNVRALPTLTEALETVQTLLEVPVPPPHVNALNRLLYANVITSLETYLSDTFINRVLDDPPVLQKFVESTPDFQKRSVTYSDVFEAVAAAKEDSKRYLLDVVWHNLAKVQAMYRDTLGIDFGATAVAVLKAVPTRHDIVHRNGKDKHGELTHVSADSVRALIQAVRALVEHIEQQLESSDSPF